METDLTVAAVVYEGGRYLMVEERSRGRYVFSQPGGHIEAGESPELAVVRETFEETGCRVRCDDLIGVYLWIRPETGRQYLRLVYAATLVERDVSLKLDDGILRRLWMPRGDIEGARQRLRSPVVLRCLHDFENGKRQGDALHSGMLPLEHNVDAVLERAKLV